MKRYTKALFLAVLLGLVAPHDLSAIGLSGSVVVNQTSNTAANAKINAMNSARRQILYNVLSQYSESESLADLLKNTSDDDLLNFISSSSVSDEHISTDSYSANITMNIDNDVVRDWLTINNVQNWVPNIESLEKTEMFIVVPNGVSDWAELKRVAYDNGFEIETVVIAGNQIYAKMPSVYRSRFTAGIRGIGWRYADNGGVLQIWK